MVGANIMEVTYGIKVLPEHDPFIELAEAGQECVGRCATAGVYLVELLPMCTYAPRGSLALSMLTTRVVDDPQ